jgi:hypothetical protein
MKNIFMKCGVMIPTFLFIVASLRAVLLGSSTQPVVALILKSCLTYCCGWQLIGFAIGHLFFADRIAEFIGWPKGHPFQSELGFANLAMGTIGIACRWFNGQFWLAGVISVSIFAWGCALVHIKDMRLNKNHNPGNAGFVFWWGIFMPIVLIVLATIHYSQLDKILY